MMSPRSILASFNASPACTWWMPPPSTVRERIPPGIAGCQPRSADCCLAIEGFPAHSANRKSTMPRGDELARKRSRTGEGSMANRHRCADCATRSAVFGWLLSVFIGLEVSIVSTPLCDTDTGSYRGFQTCHCRPAGRYSAHANAHIVGSTTAPGGIGAEFWERR